MITQEDWWGRLRRATGDDDTAMEELIEVAVVEYLDRRDAVEAAEAVIDALPSIRASKGPRPRVRQGEATP